MISGSSTLIMTEVREQEPELSFP